MPLQLLNFLPHRGHGFIPLISAMVCQERIPGMRMGGRMAWDAVRCGIQFMLPLEYCVLFSHKSPMLSPPTCTCTPIFCPCFMETASQNDILYAHFHPDVSQSPVNNCYGLGLCLPIKDEDVSESRSPSPTSSFNGDFKAVSVPSYERTH